MHEAACCADPREAGTHPRCGPEYVPDGSGSNPCRPVHCRPGPRPLGRRPPGLRSPRMVGRAPTDGRVQRARLRGDRPATLHWGASAHSRTPPGGMRRKAPDACGAAGDRSRRAPPSGPVTSEGRYPPGRGPAFADGAWREEELRALSDREIEDRLTTIPGIGPWTAQGFLVIAFDREEVVLPGDLALRKAPSCRRPSAALGGRVLASRTSRSGRAGPEPSDRSRRAGRRNLRWHDAGAASPGRGRHRVGAGNPPAVHRGRSAASAATASS